jgi:hypothetical protein
VITKQVRNEILDALSGANDLDHVVRQLIHDHPEAAQTVIPVLRATLQMIEDDRAELWMHAAKFRGLRVSEDARLRDLDYFEKYVRDLGRAVLQAGWQ